MLIKLHVLFPLIRNAAYFCPQLRHLKSIFKISDHLSSGLNVMIIVFFSLTDQSSRRANMHLGYSDSSLEVN